jgi:hypothetical protein
MFREQIKGLKKLTAQEKELTREIEKLEEETQGRKRVLRMQNMRQIKENDNGLSML